MMVITAAISAWGICVSACCIGEAADESFAVRDDYSDECAADERLDRPSRPDCEGKNDQSGDEGDEAGCLHEERLSPIAR
jgi:hypothetical protein